MTKAEKTQKREKEIHAAMRKGTLMNKNNEKGIDKTAIELVISLLKGKRSEIREKTHRHLEKENMIDWDHDMVNNHTRQSNEITEAIAQIRALERR